MAKNNPFNKYSPCGGLNGIWVARELENREDDDYCSCTTIITPNTTTISNSSECDTVEVFNDNNYEYYGNNYNIDNLKAEMQARFDFLKQYSDGSESDYEIAKYVLSTM
jgi:hypothetical protein